MSFSYLDKKELAKIAGVVSGIASDGYIYKGALCSKRLNGLYDCFKDVYTTIVRRMVEYDDEDLDECLDKNEYFDEFQKYRKLFRPFFEPNYNIGEVTAEIGARLNVILREFSYVTNAFDDEEYNEISNLFGQIVLEMTYRCAFEVEDNKRNFRFEKPTDWEQFIIEQQ